MVHHVGNFSTIRVNPIQGVGDGLDAVENRDHSVDDVEQRHQGRERRLDLLHQVDGLHAHAAGQRDGERVGDLWNFDADE